MIAGVLIVGRHVRVSAVAASHSVPDSSPFCQSGARRGHRVGTVDAALASAVALNSSTGLGRSVEQQGEDFMSKIRFVCRVLGWTVSGAMILGVVALQSPTSVSNAGQENRVQKCVDRCEARLANDLEFCATLGSLFTAPPTEVDPSSRDCESEAENTLASCMANRCGVSDPF